MHAAQLFLKKENNHTRIKIKPRGGLTATWAFIKQFYNKHSILCKLIIFILYNLVGIAVMNSFEGWNFIQWLVEVLIF